MKKLRLFLFAAVGLVLLSLSSCKKINESTDIGGDLIPAVDNVNTFETYLDVQNSKYFIASDTTKFYYTDNAVIGKLNDPVFGSTTADAYFNLSMPAYGVYPFINKDSVTIDSVVLSLSYLGAYGDTSVGTTETFHVYDISPTADFRSDTIYRVTAPEFPVGIELGSKTFSLNSLKDSTRIIRKDTTKVANVIRIPLTNQLGKRFMNFDTATVYKTDSAFRSVFKGLAVRAESFTGNGALAYINLSDRAKTNLTFYFTVINKGVKDTTSVVLAHAANGQANIIKRQPGGEYGTYAGLGASPDGKLYIQSAPGSYVRFKIPGLDTLSNRVIHRAELVMNKVPSALDNIFTPPPRLYLEGYSDTANKAYLLEADLPMTSSGAVDFTLFGGTLKLDNTYRFNLTRTVQGIITRKAVNREFRLSAPVRVSNYVGGFSTPVTIGVNNAIAYGRVVLGGGNYVDPSQRMRLRIIYSKL